MFTVKLEDVRIYAHHGLFEHETMAGNEFRVDVSVSYPLKDPVNDPSELEDISRSVSYVAINQIVADEMAIPRKLLETVCYSIVSKIKKEFPFVEKINCKITKLSPPISYFQGAASVEFNI